MPLTLTVTDSNECDPRTAEATVDVVVSDALIENSAPNCAITGPIAGSEGEEGAVVAFTATATDDIVEHFFLPTLNRNHVMKNFHLQQQCNSILENENL